MQKLNNILGAFADGAILFPLMALLTVKAGFSGSMILLVTGIVYLVTSIFYRVPMSVQPLKSIAVAAITVGASFSEVQVSGLLLGFFCIGLLYFDVEKISKKVPSSVIHQLQLGLGILLIFQGLKNGLNFLVILSSLVVVFIPSISGVPLLGLLATVGLFFAVFTASAGSPTSGTVTHSIFDLDAKLRFGMIASLLLPQLALTMTNSVLATQDVAIRAFGDRAHRVTIRNLLKTIGIGNVLSSFVGGMPFCHGSGGLTAHIKGGSTQSWSTALMGILLMILSLFQFLKGTSALNFHPSLVSILLIATGVFHIQLSKPTFNISQGRIKLLVAGVLTVVSRNLLVVLTGAILLELFFHYFEQEKIVND